jgi:Tol biopolymer transport system component
MTSQNTSRDEFDLLLGEWMESEARVREPEHLLDSVLERTRSARRIPRWLVLERWIPVQLTMPLRAAPRLAPLLLVIVLVLAAIAVAIVLVGSKPRLPDPFGPAANGRVAFLSNGQIHAANPDGSNPIQLTFGSRPAATPVWSRDGTRVAYKLISPASPADDPTLFGDLVVVNADGTNPVTIDRDLKGMSPTAWSPDSRWLLYSRAEGTIDQIYVAAADGSSPPVRVGDPATLNWAPVFSPDGTKIAYFVGSTNVEVMNRDGSEAKRLNTTTFSELSSFEWHPDGKRIVVSAAATKDESFDLWILSSLDEAPEQHLQVPGRAEVAPSWSPDGSRLLYLTTKDGRSTKVAIAAADGTNERLLPGGYSMIGPTWSPDGSRIAAVNDLGTFPRVTILDPDGVAKPILIDGILPAPSFIAARSDTPTWQRIAP